MGQYLRHPCKQNAFFTINILWIFTWIYSFVLCVCMLQQSFVNILTLIETRWKNLIPSHYETSWRQNCYKRRKKDRHLHHQDVSPCSASSVFSFSEMRVLCSRYRHTVYYTSTILWCGKLKFNLLLLWFRLGCVVVLLLWLYQIFSIIPNCRTFLV